MMTNSPNFSNQNFECKACDVICISSKDLDRHFLTRKHKKMTLNDKSNDAKSPPKSHSCENCGKIYKYRQGLFSHKKKCNLEQEKKINDDEELLKEFNNQPIPIELILHLIKELQKIHGTAVLFITHDFGVVAEIADRVAVMQGGELVEVGSAQQVLNAPTTAYSRQLIDAVPSLSPRVVQSNAASSSALLNVTAVSKTYAGQRSWFSRGTKGVMAVNNVSLTLPKQGSLAIVGESGSGKSTLARCIIGLEKNESGAIELENQVINGLTRRALRPIRQKIQMIFQDPFSSLNPRQKVGDIISLGPMIQGVTRDEAWTQARELLRRVGLRAEAADRYPHEFSGGQRQRIGIARALAVKPKLIVADEPVSALDVSVQKQVLELLDELREEMGLSLLFITHDLRVAATVCENILIMSKGQVVEQGTTEDVFARPSHPYTQSLLAAIPGQAWSRSLSKNA
jgi:peptide/nickel transport system ATP-binding protein